MAYRDEHERCPRCATDLTDAVVGLACVACRGLWIAPSSVYEMAVNMQTPPDLIDLPYAQDAGREKLPCPTCRDGMEIVTLFEIPIDLCSKHGIWFDANELATVLMRAARRP